MEKQVCPVCPHHCSLGEGDRGFCRARQNINGKIEATNYGVISSLALDPIEKKPLAMFMPGSFILSVGNFGCNMSCPFCQNHEISQVLPAGRYGKMSPRELSDMAQDLSLSKSNVGIAYTYNEPLVCYEFVRDTAKLVSEMGLVNVLVSNGQVTLDIAEEILPYMNAMNIDLKAFTEEGYQRLGGDLKTTMDFISTAAPKCHVEITSLIVPGLNDSKDDMEREAAWIASLDPSIPLHITRFFPRYKWDNIPPTDVSLMTDLRDIAKRHLENVFLGNV